MAEPTTRETFGDYKNHLRTAQLTVDLRWDPIDRTGFPQFYRVAAVVGGVEIAEGCVIQNGDGEGQALQNLALDLAMKLAKAKLGGA